MINSPKGNRTDVSGVMFRKLLVLRSLHTCKQTSWRKEKMKNKKRKLSDFVEYLKSRQFFGVCMCNYVLHRNEGEV